MPTHVHSVMENAHHHYVTIDRTIEYHMATNTALAISFADHITRTPKTWVVGYLAKALVDQTHVAFGLLLSPSFDRVLPDLLKVGNRLWAKGKFSH